jgi:hypothetical protein
VCCIHDPEVNLSSAVHQLIRFAKPHGVRVYSVTNMIRAEVDSVANLRMYVGYLYPADSQCYSNRVDSRSLVPMQAPRSFSTWEPGYEATDSKFTWDLNEP